MPVRDRDYFTERRWGGEHPPVCTCVVCNDRRLKGIPPRSAARQQTPAPSRQTPAVSRRNHTPSASGMAGPILFLLAVGIVIYFVYVLVGVIADYQGNPDDIPALVGQRIEKSIHWVADPGGPLPAGGASSPVQEFHQGTMAPPHLEVAGPASSAPSPPAVISDSSPTPHPNRQAAGTKQDLKEVDCGPGCDWDYAPAFTTVKWLQGPTVTETGILSLKATIGDNDPITLPGTGGGASNIALTDGGTKLYGYVIPPIPAGWSWDPKPGQWVAETYTYRNNTLTVSARINPSAANHKGLRLCLWTGGSHANNRVLDCVPVQKRP